MSAPKYILPTIVFAQLAGTSLWFAGNAVMGDVSSLWALPDGAIGWVTSSVQFGFIVGTLISAITTLSDRVSVRWLFVACAIFAAIANLLPLLIPGLASLLISRFFIGVFLAGIYPVGMKLAASWYQAGLSTALGWLVGALVLGTASGHLIRAFAPSWQVILWSVSALAAIGGLSIAALVPEGPHIGQAAPFSPTALFEVFKKADFRAAALGYFGHMWELYAFWALVPAIVATLLKPSTSSLSFASGTIIALGALGCVVGGFAARKLGSSTVAFWHLILSGALALSAPLWLMAPQPIAWICLGLWGYAVVADSPQFSTLTAKTAPNALVGTGLTIVTSIGFAVTILSIEATSALLTRYAIASILPLLAIGPVFGLISMRPLRKRD